MNILKEWYNGLMYPFKQKDWLSRMWLISVLGVVFTPFVEIIILRGWRVELVRRIALKEDSILPRSLPQDVLKYFVHGIKLWLITGLYILFPIILFKILGINPLMQFWKELVSFVAELWQRMRGGGSGVPLDQFLWQSFKAIAYELMIQNAWLLFYYPYYRTATIRYAITNKFRKSHLSVLRNIRFMIINVLDFIMMVINQFIDKLILYLIGIIINIVLTPFVGVFVVIFLAYAAYWTSGYEYGMLAQKMIKQDYPQLLQVDVTEEGDYDQPVEFV